MTTTSPVAVTELSVPPPFFITSSAEAELNWWPREAADPRQRLAWAEGARWADDGIGFLGSPGGPAAWLRLATGDQAFVRMNAVDVCAGTGRDVVQDTATVDAARVEAARQLVLAANGYVSPLVCRDAPEGEQTARLFEAALQAAQCDGRLPAVLHCPQGDSLTEAAQARGFVCGVTDLYPVIHLPGNGIDDYVAALPKQRRSGVRKELRARSRTECHVLRGDDAASHIDEAAQLVSMAYTARGQHMAAQKVAAIFTRLHGTFGDDFLLTMVSSDGAPVATACLVAGHDALLLYFVGLDPDRARQVSGYFNAAYYLPMEYAYERGITRLLVGPGTVESKRRRGARFEPLVSAVPARSKLALLLARTDAELTERVAALNGTRS
ncbi:GNAT family N-acetyltransferase [Streptomyces sp. NPDC051684]|uniref:GNAT family N-acetyltransferase n=1 Tax=Streptomyces sp. NPDC051684 TaxID=3365670 RepID=UPI0037B413AC